ncbi:hypothetical protein [Stenotrophomonas sp. SMYL82]|uniref:hypothetical protein n=1 Tax=Stenotrophomonas sp. SMYL82 TaxID=3076048 RepID=UPI002E76C9F3|nr:hypothetical protein [Stenotrophomonas sp. SMYL82]
MSNDNKTLADVQPGGRVRLGDRPKDGEVLLEVSGLTGSGKSAIAGEIEILCKALGLQVEWVNGDEEKRLTHADWIGALEMYKPRVVIVEQNISRAALSAQPPPGGQDALLESLVARWRNHAEEIGVSDNLLCQKVANCTMRHAAELQAALAARQPVGEPVGYFDPDVLAHLTEGLIDPVGVLRRKPNGKSNVPVWLGPPAQAVDLGPSQSVLAEVAQERARQEAKWGQQNHVDWTPTSAATDLAGAWPAGVGDHFKFITDYKAKGVEGHRLGYFDILMEEVAEAHDEARDGNTKATRAELVQVAAVAVAWIECIDRRLALTGSQAVGK